MSRGRVGIGCWVSGLLVGTYNTTHQEHLLVKPFASAPTSCITVVGGVRAGGV